MLLYVLPRVTICVIITVFCSKGSMVFWKLELHVLRGRKTLYKIWLNPG